MKRWIIFKTISIKTTNKMHLSCENLDIYSILSLPKTYLLNDKNCLCVITQFYFYLSFFLKLVI